MNGSNVWGLLAPYGDILTLFKWNLYKKNNYYVFHGRVTLFFANNSLTQYQSNDPSLQSDYHEIFTKKFF